MFGAHYDYYGSRPWIRAADSNAAGLEVRYTRKDDAVDVFLLKWPPGGSVVFPNMRLVPGSDVVLLESGQPIRWRQNGEAVTLEMAAAAGDSVPVLRLRPVERG